MRGPDSQNGRLSKELVLFSGLFSFPKVEAAHYPVGTQNVEGDMVPRKDVIFLSFPSVYSLRLKCLSAPRHLSLLRLAVSPGVRDKDPVLLNQLLLSLCL